MITCDPTVPATVGEAILAADSKDDEYSYIYRMAMHNICYKLKPFSTMVRSYWIFYWDSKLSK